MIETLLIKLEQPQFVNGKKLLFAGFGRTLPEQTCAGILAQWQQFVPIQDIPGQIGRQPTGDLQPDGAGSREKSAVLTYPTFAVLRYPTLPEHPKNAANVRIPEQTEMFLSS